MNDIKIIAEISSNHMGDMKLACKMIESASKNGANFVKFQTWKVKRLQPGPWDVDGSREIYNIAELSDSQHELLSKVCKENGVEFLTSCFSVHDLDFVRKITNKIKIASSECSNINLVNKAIQLFDVVFISTGASTESEYIKWANYENVFLLHCVSKYPCSSDMINLHKLIHIKQITSRFGYSGHYFGIWDAIAAISLGARIVEKHFTIDRSLSFKDNKFSILPDQLRQIREYADEFSLMFIDRGVDFQTKESVVRDIYSHRWEGLP